MKQKNFTDTAVRDEQGKRINELNEFIEQQDSELTEFDESLARRWLKEIVVWDDRFSVELKLGVIIEIEIWFEYAKDLSALMVGRKFYIRSLILAFISCSYWAYKGIRPFEVVAFEYV